MRLSIDGMYTEAVGYQGHVYKYSRTWTPLGPGLVS